MIVEKVVSPMPFLPESSIPVSRSTEVRWFIPGDGPPLCKDRVRLVIDSYACELLADGVSLKVRDADLPGVFLKIRTAVHPPMACGDVDGVPETWLRIEAEQLPSNAHGDRFEVRKRIVKRKGIEVTHLEFGDEVWWTLAVRMQGSAFPRLPREIAKHLRRHRAIAVSCSYPTWLLNARTSNASPQRCVLAESGLRFAG
jgi:hypothetical protein